MSNHKALILYVFKSTLKLKYQTYSAFSKASGIPASHISEHLRGKRHMDLDQFIVYCRNLGLDFIFFSDGPLFSFNIHSDGSYLNMGLDALIKEHDVNETGE